MVGAFEPGFDDASPLVEVFTSFFVVGILLLRLPPILPALLAMGILLLRIIAVFECSWVYYSFKTNPLLIDAGLKIADSLQKAVQAMVSLAHLRPPS